MAFAKFGARAGVLAGIVLIAACAQAGRWQHPRLAEDRWSRDISACRVQARTISERESRIDRLFESGDALAAEPSFTLQRNLGRYQTARRETRIFGECMRKKGYAKVAIKPARS